MFHSDVGCPEKMLTTEILSQSMIGVSDSFHRLENVWIILLTTCSDEIKIKQRILFRKSQHACLDILNHRLNRKNHQCEICMATNYYQIETFVDYALISLNQL